MSEKPSGRWELMRPDELERILSGWAVLPVLYYGTGGGHSRCK
jgi:hypothetical protein